MNAALRLVADVDFFGSQRNMDAREAVPSNSSSGVSTSAGGKFLVRLLRALVGELNVPLPRSSTGRTTTRTHSHAVPRGGPANVPG